MAERLLSPLEQKMKEIHEKGFLYLPNIRPIPDTAHNKLLIGGKAYIETMSSDTWTTIIRIKFKDVPTIEFQFSFLEPMQKDLEEEFKDKLAHYEE